eukprot:6175622-Prymnesium_polylepis.1
MELGVDESIARHPDNLTHWVREAAAHRVRKPSAPSGRGHPRPNGRGHSSRNRAGGRRGAPPRGNPRPGA